MKRMDCFTVFAILTPVIVVLSGMAMVPVLIILALVMLISLPRETLRNPQVFLSNYRTLFILICVIGAVPLLLSPWSFTPAKSFDTASRVFTLCLVGLAALAYAPALARPSKKTITAYAVSIAVASLLVLQEIFLKTGLIATIYRIGHMDYSRFMDKNVNRGLCALTVLIWPLVLALFQRKEHILTWCIVAFMALPIMLMHSLSAKVGLCASVIAFAALIYYPTTVSRIIAVTLPLLLLGFPFAFHYMETTVFADPVIREHLPPSGLHRLTIWHALLDQSAQRPWFGWGIDTTRAMPLSPEQFSAINLQTPPLHPHSPSIQLLLEEGFIGFLLTIGAIALLLREWLRMPMIANNYQRPIIGAVIAAYFFTGISSFGIWQHWWIATLWLAGLFLQWMKQPAENAVVTPTV